MGWVSLLPRIPYINNNRGRGIASFAWHSKHEIFAELDTDIVSLVRRLALVYVCGLLTSYLWTTGFRAAQCLHKLRCSRRRCN